MAKKPKYTKQDGFASVAKSLRDFGYPDCTSQMIADTYEAMKRGDDKMPHGIIGMFAERQLAEVRETFDAMPEA